MRYFSFCFQMHAPRQLKRYRFFDIGQDHYYADDMLTEEHLDWLVRTSYMPLCQTLREMIRLSKGAFRCGICISGTLLELFEQFAPDMMEVLKALSATKSVEFVAAPYSYSIAGAYNIPEVLSQIEQQQALIEELFGQRSTTVCNAELLYDDEIAAALYKKGYKAVMVEGAKHVLSWKSPNYVYQSASAPKLKVLMRHQALCDELAFHFSDPAWHHYPMEASDYAARIASMPAEEPVVNMWVGAECFGVLQNAGTGIFEFLKALPYYLMEREMGFLTPSEVVKKVPVSDTVVVPYPMTWAGEAKDLSTYNGNDLQQEALNKLYAVSERVRLCQDKQLKQDWLMLQDVHYLHYMNHIDRGGSPFDSAYDAFINYMNILSDFLQRVKEQYPSSIENEELNALLQTITNQEQEIASLEEQVKALRKRKKE